MQSPQCSSRTGHVRHSTVIVVSWAVIGPHPSPGGLATTLGATTDTPGPSGTSADRGPPGAGPAQRASPGVSVRTPTVSGMTMVQGTFDDLGTPLSTVTFVVVDLETTGGSPVECGITEIGAVKVRGGEVLGEFQTLVNPGEPDPARSSPCSPASPTPWSPARRASRRRCRRSSSSPRGSRARRPQRRLRHVVPQGGGRAAPSTSGPASRVLDTVHLARQLVRRDEVPNHRLATLARLFRATTTPTTAPSTTPAPPSTSSTASSSASGRSACTPSRSCSTTPPGSPLRAVASATSPTTCPTRRASTSSRTARAASSTSARRSRIRTRVRVLLHRVRAPPPDGRDGRASPSR